MYFVRRAQSRIDQATLENEIVEGDNSRTGGDREWPGALLARRTRTIRMCSFDARSEGQPGHSLPREDFALFQRECVLLTYNAASNGLKLGSTTRRIELFSLGLLSFSILLTFDQQFCSR